MRPIPFVSSLIVSSLVSSLIVGEAVAGDATAQVKPDAVMLRTPDVSRDLIVFRYADDLWLVDKRGGIARSLSSPAGPETMPKFSPDGRQIAFMAGYDGGSDLYVLSVDGGIPVRVTHHPDREVLCDWTPDGKELIFFSSQVSGQQRSPKLFRVGADGGQPVALPMPYGTFAAIDETATWVAYSPQTWSLNANWKRYQGGIAEDIWLFNLNTRTEWKRLTNHPGVDALPMWHGSTIVFLSDRGENARRNLVSIDAKSGETRQLTNFEGDVHYPSGGPDDVVFENGGRLWRYEFASAKTVQVEIVIPTDRPSLRARSVDCAPLVATVAPGPSGKRVVVEARGELFSVPAKEGATQNLTRSDGIAERSPSWSPDARWIAYVSDRSGENELTVRAADGRPFKWGGDTSEVTEKTLTQLGAGFRFRPLWAPDSKSLVFSSNDGALHRVTLADGAHEILDSDPDGNPMGAAWSPDSRWIAYAHRSSGTRLPAIFLYDTAQKQRHEVTSGEFADARPTFDRNGEWLYFVRQSTFQPIYSDFDETWIYANSGNLVAVPLRTDVKNPWAPKNDDEAVEKADDKKPDAKPGEKKDDGKKEGEKKEGDAKEGEAAKKPPASIDVKPVEITIEGFEARAILVDVPSGPIDGLQGAKGKVLYLRPPRAGSGAGRSDDDGAPPASTLMQYDLEKKKEERVLDGVSRFEICANGERVLVNAGGFGFIDAAPEQKLETKLALANLDATIDPRQEWSQILTDAGRLVRDLFYQEDTHHVDWSAVVQRYRRALVDCTTREDVDFLIREMLGELNCGHTYDSPPPEMQTGRSARPVGLLGCDWVLDQGAFKLARILGGGSYDADARSPLSIPGVDVKAGQYVLAVNDAPIDASRDVYLAFEGTAGKPTWITVNDAPRLDGKERRILVKPMGGEAELRYRDWVARNRELVGRLSNGRIGYVHVPDTGVHGQNELVRQFMGAFAKDALLIDERWNSGGQIPTRFIELLNRPITNYWAVRHGEDWTWPQVGHRGPKCMLINEASGSGGDCFPYYFKQAALGKLIGRRTWGGLVGLSGNPSFIDGSAITVPTFGFYEKDGTWAVEGHGVDPDVEVIDDPTRMVEGDDPQLLAAVDHLLVELKSWRFDRVKRPASPDRSKAGIRPEDF